MKNKIKFIANACRWFDKVNGNTYHSVNITRVSDGKTLYCPFQYGYGDAYRESALKAMLKAGWLPEKYGKPTKNLPDTSYMYERENEYPIFWNVKETTQKECKRNGGE